MSSNPYTDLFCDLANIKNSIFISLFFNILFISSRVRVMAITVFSFLSLRQNCDKIPFDRFTVVKALKTLSGNLHRLLIVEMPQVVLSGLAHVAGRVPVKQRIYGSARSGARVDRGRFLTLAGGAAGIGITRSLSLTSRA